MKKFSEIKNEIMPVCKDLEAFRVKKLNNSRLRIAVFFILIFTIFNLVFFDYWDIEEASLPSLLFCLVFVIFLIFGVYMNDNERQYGALFKQVLFIPIIHIIDPALTFHEGIIDKKLVIESGLFPLYNKIPKKLQRLEGEYLFEGKKRRTKIQLGEIKIGREWYFGKGIYGFDRMDFEGLYIVLENERWDYEPLYIVSKPSDTSGQKQKAPLIGEKMLEEELYPEFLEQFWVYGTASAQLKNFLNITIPLIIYLQEHWDTDTRLSFNKNKIYIALSLGKQKLFEPKLNTSLLDGTEVEKLYNQLAHCFQTIDDFAKN